MIPVLEGKSRQERRELARQLERDNKAYPATLTEVEDPRCGNPGCPTRVMRSRHFLVQIYDDAGYVRLSVNRTQVDELTWGWREGITWDELQRLKREAGYGDRDAVEVYPPDSDVVNVANLRHIWIMNEPLPFAWRRGVGG